MAKEVPVEYRRICFSKKKREYRMIAKKKRTRNVVWPCQKWLMPPLHGRIREGRGLVRDLGSEVCRIRLEEGGKGREKLFGQRFWIRGD